MRSSKFEIAPDLILTHLLVSKDGTKFAVAAEGSNEILIYSRQFELLSRLRFRFTQSALVSCDWSCLDEICTVDETSCVLVYRISEIEKPALLDISSVELVNEVRFAESGRSLILSTSRELILFEKRDVWLQVSSVVVEFLDTFALHPKHELASLVTRRKEHPRSRISFISTSSNEFGQLIHDLDKFFSDVNWIEFSNSGTHLCIALVTSEVCFFRLDSNFQILESQILTTPKAPFLSFSHLSERELVCVGYDRELILLQNSGSEKKLAFRVIRQIHENYCTLHELEHHTNCVTRVRWLLGREVVTSACDGCVVIWSL